MTNWHSTNDTFLRCLMLTPHLSISGALQGSHVALSDALNSTERSYAQITSAVVASLAPDSGGELLSSTMLLRKEHVVIGVPQDERDIEVSVRVATRQPEKSPQVVMLKAGPFVITGQVLVTRGAGLMDLLMEANALYLPVLDGAVSHESGALADFTAPYLLLNRRWIDAVVEDPHPAPALNQIEAKAESIEPLLVGVSQSRIDHESAAEILLATDVFKESDFQTLLSLMPELTAADGITRCRLQAGGDIIRQGEEGDDLYVVERGTLQVLADDSERPLAVLHVGDVFGEMALLGNRRRKATVRVVHDATLLKVNAPSWRVLSRTLPRVATNLMKLMTSRTGSSWSLLGRQS